MKLLTAKDLPRRLDELLEGCGRLDVAVAYCCSGGPLDSVIAASRVQLRAILGIDDGVTSPVAIGSLLSRPNTSVRLGTVCPPVNQRFHPKVYLFRARNEADSVA